MNDVKTRDEVIEMLRSFRAAMVTTVDEDDKLVSRPMAPMHVDDDGTLWFFTELDSEKVDDVRANPQANVTFAHSDYVSVSGDASTVRDVDLQSRLWNKVVETWLQCEPDDPKVALLEIVPDSIAYWQTPNTVASLFGMAKAAVTGDQPDTREAGVVEM